MKTIILGVTGSIAAYKAADIVSQLTKENFCVHVVMTRSSQQFITPLTLQTLSKNRVYTDVFQEEEPTEVKHITLSEQCDILVIAPASGNIINKLATGIADDMLTCVALAMWEKPLIIAPAMNTKMYFNPTVQDSLKRLESRGSVIVEPKESRLACGDYGKGALANISSIIDAIKGINV